MTADNIKVGLCCGYIEYHPNVFPQLDDYLRQARSAARPRLEIKLEAPAEKKRRQHEPYHKGGMAADDLGNYVAASTKSMLIVKDFAATKSTAGEKS
jgi:hypothetical protein